MSLQTKWLLRLLVIVACSVSFASGEEVRAAGSQSEWYDNFIFENKSFSSQLVRNLAWTYSGAADVGEVISTAQKIKDGDIYSWHREWLALAQRVSDLGTAWEKDGHATSASEAYFRAATYFQAAGFFMVAPKDRDKARYCRKKGRESFQKAIRAHPNISFVRIPYQGTTLPAYLARSEKASGQGPMIIANTGFDGTAEDTFNGSGWAALKRGYHFLVFEGPGQGEMIMDHDLPFRHDWEVVGKAVIDYALSQPFVDEERLAYMGISMGGYLAPRVLAFDDRPKALIANGGLYKLYRSMYKLFSEEQLALLESDPQQFNEIVEEMNRKDLSFQWLFDNAVWRFGAEDYADLMVGQKKYDLEEVAPNIKSSTLVVESVADGMFLGQPEDLYQALTCEKSYVVFTREEAAQAHCQLGASSLSNEKILNWLDTVLQPGQKPAMFKLHHLGFVVRDLDEAVKIYADILGIDPNEDGVIERFTGKANKTAMVPIGPKEEHNSFELMEPVGDHWLDVYIKAERAQGFFHLAALVDNFDERVRMLRQKGYEVKVDETENPFPGCELLREAYVIPPDGTRGILFDLIDAENFPEHLGGLAPSPQMEQVTRQ